MKGARTLLWIFIFALHGQAIANDADYKFCSIAGFAKANGDEFIYSLAYQARERKKLPLDALCKAAHKVGFDAQGQMIANRSASDLEVANQYFAFKVRIENTILHMAGY